MLTEQEKRLFSKRLLNPDLSYLAKKSIHTQILRKAKKNTKCPNCGALNGGVKKGPGLMKILHDPFKGKKSTDPLVTNALDELLAYTKDNREINTTITTTSLIEELSPLTVLELFRNIPKSDITFLGMTSEGANPKNLIVTRVFVPPVCIRPSVVSEIKSGT